MSSPSTTIPEIVFLFGLAGAGKTYCGKILAERLGYFCYDLDRDITPEMRGAIAERQPFSEKMRDDFFAVVCRRIRELRREHPRVIFMQAAYKERHRELVSSEGEGIQMVWVDAPDELIFQRLNDRGDQVSAEYASHIRANFEAPKAGKRLLNDVSDGDILWERFQALFADKG